MNRQELIIDTKKDIADNYGNGKRIKVDRLMLLFLLATKVETFTSNGGLKSVSNALSYNRGEIVEQLIKGIVFNVTDTFKTNCKSDLQRLTKSTAKAYGLDSRCYEIKFSTSYAYATKITTKCKYIILVNEEGVYLCTKDQLTYSKRGEVKPQNTGILLERLTKELFGR